MKRTTETETVGETFGPFRLVRSLGRGGMAETFVAERSLEGTTGLRTCVKRILPGLLDDPELARQFDVEATIAATLQHANIAGLVDHGQVDGRHYLALELVDGIDLRALLRHARRAGAKVDSELIAEVVFGVLHALDFAHAITAEGTVSGIVHRDLSPSNVLLGRHGEVKLADFGIAKIMGASHHTRTGVLRGKIPYMPPEYIRGGTFSAAGDLFALGVMLFECLADERPFRGANEAETLDRITRDERRSLRELRPDLDSAWYVTVDTLLENDPGSRPTRARDVLTLLAPVAPRASARGRLAREVAALAPAPDSPPTLPFDATEVAELIRHESRPIVPASPDAATKTRLPI